MRTFELVRTEDTSGVSGTGRVAEGVEFADGAVVIRWRSVPFTSTAIYTDIKELEAIHGHGGRTKIEFCEAKCSK